VKPVVPLLVPLLSAGATPMATPLAGFVEFTVSRYVVGGGGLEVLPPPPPPQEVGKMHVPSPIHTVQFHPNLFMRCIQSSRNPNFGKACSERQKNAEESLRCRYHFTSEMPTPPLPR
jgi:hypothetical protein